MDKIFWECKVEVHWLREARNVARGGGWVNPFSLLSSLRLKKLVNWAKLLFCYFLYNTQTPREYRCLPVEFTLCVRLIWCFFVSENSSKGLHNQVSP